MECKKKTFETKEEAKTRAKEIAQKSGKALRTYQCDECNYFHLTSMTKKKYVHKEKWTKSISYRNKIRERNFINRESAYWEKKFNINQNP